MAVIKKLLMLTNKSCYRKGPIRTDAKQTPTLLCSLVVFPCCARFVLDLCSIKGKVVLISRINGVSRVRRAHRGRLRMWYARRTLRDEALNEALTSAMLRKSYY